MSNLSTNLKTWGAQGSEYPDGYNYLEDEEPVDAWDNFLIYNVIENIGSLISTVNGRLESEAASSEPSSPEVGHLVHRTDAPAQDAHEELYYYDGASASFNRLMRADGDTMDGPLDMGGNELTDSSGALSLNSRTEIQNASLDRDWYSKFEGGTVAAGSSVPLRTVSLADGDTLSLTEAHLTEDGFTTAAATDVTLAIVANDGTTTTVLNGDGATLYDQQTGSPVASYTNTSGGSQTVMVAIDNGEYTTGNGTDQQAFGGFIARVH